MSGPVVVGVSPTTGSPRALRWAADYARTHSAPLRAVMAWRPPRAPAAPAGRPPATVVGVASTDYASEAEQRLREHVAAALGTSDAVELRALRGSAVSALIAASGDAELLVVGEVRPGRSGTVQAGLVAPQVVLRSRCPVVVMPRH